MDYDKFFYFYDIFPQSKEALEKVGLNLHYLATWRDLLGICREQEYFSLEVLVEVERFLDDPISWSGAHGEATELPILEEQPKIGVSAGADSG